MVAKGSHTGRAVGLVEVEPSELRAMLERGEATLIDVREADEHARERIEGARLLPLSRFDPSQIAEEAGRQVVLHCRSGARSAQAARQLLGAGRPAAHHLRGGIRAWRAAGLPVVENPRVPMSIMRQVQIVAGAMVVLGTALGAWVDPWFLALSGFVGAGQLYAGLTGTCGLATVLGWMPWNRLTRGTPGACGY